MSFSWIVKLLYSRLIKFSTTTYILIYALLHRKRIKLDISLNEVVENLMCDIDVYNLSKTFSLYHNFYLIL